MLAPGQARLLVIADDLIPPSKSPGENAQVSGRLLLHRLSLLLQSTFQVPMPQSTDPFIGIRDDYFRQHRQLVWFRHLRAIILLPPWVDDIRFLYTMATTCRDGIGDESEASVITFWGRHSSASDTGAIIVSYFSSIAIVPIVITPLNFVAS
jgi:hypothetical protein